MNGQLRWFGLAALSIGCAELKTPPTAVERADILADARGGVTPNAITISPAAATLGATMTLQLTVTVTNKNGVPQPDREFAFSSDAPEVASVDAAGLVTAHQDGTAHISASSGGANLTAVAAIMVRTPTVSIALSPFYQGTTAGSGQAGFSVVGDFPQVEFSCRLNGTVTPCVSQISWNELPHGSQLVIEVTATDVSVAPHITGPTARAVATIDAQGPTISDLAPTGTTGPNTVVTFSSDESPAGGVLFFWSLDASAQTGIFAGTPIELRDLPEGPHTLTIFAVDHVGNMTNASLLLDVDALGPVFDLSQTRAPAGPVGPQSTAETAILFAAVDRSLPVTYRCSLDGSASAPCASPATVGKFEWSGLSDGSHSLRVIAYDAFNNQTELEVINFLVVVPPG